ncbi:hypothetical protein PR048_031805 [Dryococelus australis]|uniref:Uncharacterized protein n=1 Tax=Dryococelus australis TaxID=614101 RepID=A0ABQ9G6D4_9NEOP|nr:hypothetical protein PR048_031805 [Dryococelus australis]
MLLWKTIAAEIDSPMPAPEDLNPLDFYLRGHLKALVYATRVDDVCALRNRIVAGCEIIRNTSRIHQRIRESMQRRVDACVSADMAIDDWREEKRAAREVTSGREICDCEHHSSEEYDSRLGYWTRCIAEQVTMMCGVTRLPCIATDGHVASARSRDASRSFAVLLREKKGGGGFPPLLAVQQAALRTAGGVSTLALGRSGGQYCGGARAGRQLGRASHVKDDHGARRAVGAVTRLRRRRRGPDTVRQPALHLPQHHASVRPRRLLLFRRLSGKYCSSPSQSCYVQVLVGTLSLLIVTSLFQTQVTGG